MANYLDPNKVDAIIRWFETTPDLQLEELKEKARGLSAQHYWYCKATSTANQQYVNARIERKAAHARKMEFHRPSCSSEAAAKRKVENDEEYRRLYGAEYDAKRLLDGAVRHCKSIDLNLSRMQQEIADLRKEREYQKFTDGSPLPKE